MNNVPNNDSEQCIELRLGWVRRVHTLNPSWAPGRPCRGAPGAVSHASPGRIVAFLSAVSSAVPRAVSPRSCSRYCASCRNLLGYVAWLPAVSWRMPGHVAVLYRDTTSGKAFLLSRYKRLYRDTPHKPGLPPVMIQPIVS